MKINSSFRRIIAIDPGFDRLGVAILDKEGQKETLIFSDCIISSRAESLSERIFFIGEQIEKIIKKHKPSEFAIEKLFFTTNQKTVMTVAEVRGVCLYMAKKYKLSVFEYSPPEIKVAITGYGRASKDDVSMMVFKIIKMDNEKKFLDDEIDAIAIGLTHSAIVKRI